MSRKFFFLPILALAPSFADEASASVFYFNDGIAAGRARFDATVEKSGGTVAHDVWSDSVIGTSAWVRPHYTVSTNSGDDLRLVPYGIFTDQFYPTLSGNGAEVTIGGNSDGPALTPWQSGITLTFTVPVNAFGIEVGDWGTCCWNPTSDILISFDDRDPVTVGSVDRYTEYTTWQPSQFNPNIISSSVFFSLFDDSGAFTKVSIWGNGMGEAIVFGGDVRWSHLAPGSLTPAMAITPLPAGAWLLSSALFVIGAAARKRKRPGCPGRL